MNHTAVNGYVIHCRPTLEEAAYLERLRVALLDDAVTRDAFVALIYNAENPVMQRRVDDTRGWVTTETLANPVYRVMFDLLFRKQHDADELARLEAAHNIPLSEAADSLRIHVSAMRQAVAAGRVSSWLKDGKHYVSAASLDAYRSTFSPRGPKPRDGRR